MGYNRTKEGRGGTNHLDSSSSIMPRNNNGRYWVPGANDDRTISRMTRYHYPQARNSSRHANIPYPTADFMIDCIDTAPGSLWYRNPAPEYHLRDFIYHTRMQTVRRCQERLERFPGRDLVLERLIVKGTYDQQAPDTPNVQEEIAMNHSSAMVQRLLMRIEGLEAEVCCSARSRG